MSGRAASDAVIPGRAAISVGNPDTPLPMNWVWTPLTSVADLGTGHTPSRKHPEYWGGDVPWIGIRDAGAHHGGAIYDTLQRVNQLGLDNSSARLLPKDTVCLSRTASVGYVVKMGRDMATSQDFVTWSCTEALDPDFLMQALLAEGADIRRFGEGSTHTTIYFPEVKAFHVALPPLPEQRRIVAKIDSLTAKSRRARDHLDHIPRLVEKYKQAVLAAAFRGDLTLNWRNERGGDLDSWKAVTLGDIAEIQSGVALGKKRRPDIQLVRRPYLRVANVQRGRLDLSDVKTIEVTENEAAALTLRVGDILMNEGGDRDKLGRGWVWGGQVDDCIHQNHVFRVRLKDAAFPPELISLFANEFGQAHFSDEGTQTTNLASISKSRLSLLPLVLPPADEAAEMLVCIRRAFTWIDRLAAEATSARTLVDQLDQAVLAKAFRGELVPQDSADEPASVLLDRIRTERAAAPKAKRGRRTGALP